MSLNLNKTDLKDGLLTIQNDDGSIKCIPEESATEEEKAWFEEFRQAFPEGKPEPEIEPTTPVPSEMDLLKAQIETMQGALDFIIMNS